MRASRAILVAATTVALVGAIGGSTLAQDESASPDAGGAGGAAPVTATPGQDVKMMFLPKFLDNEVFVQANNGAQEAAAELQIPTPVDFVGPVSTDPGSAQIDYVVNAPTQGYDVVMLSNNAGEDIADAAAAAQEAGTRVVTWDSSIPSATGESLFVAQVDFDETGQVMADMALRILGEDGGQFAILSARPESSNQNAWIAAMEEVLQGEAYASLELVETVYGNDNVADSEAAATGLLDEHPDLELIMAPTTVGIRAAAKVVTDEGRCEEIKVSGLGLPSEMKEYVLNGCSPEFALWSFTDLGYLTTYVSYLLATGALQGADGETFSVGRPISEQTTFTITADPTRPDTTALRVLMGPFSVYNADNIEEAAPDASAPA
jgi:rhamnose transport system substrate-binding protein